MWLWVPSGNCRGLAARARACGKRWVVMPAMLLSSAGMVAAAAAPPPPVLSLAGVRVGMSLPDAIAAAREQRAGWSTPIDKLRDQIHLSRAPSLRHRAGASMTTIDDHLQIDVLRGDPQERVFALARETTFAVDSAPRLEPLVDQLMAQYGRPTRSGSNFNINDRPPKLNQFVWFFDPSGAPAPEPHRCRGLDPEQRVRLFANADRAQYAGSGLLAALSEHCGRYVIASLTEHSGRRGHVGRAFVLVADEPRRRAALTGDAGPAGTAALPAGLDRPADLPGAQQPANAFEALSPQRREEVSRLAEQRCADASNLVGLEQDRRYNECRLEVFKEAGVIDPRNAAACKAALAARVQFDRPVYRHVFDCALRRLPTAPNTNDRASVRQFVEDVQGWCQKYVLITGFAPLVGYPRAFEACLTKTAAQHGLAWPPR